MKCEIDRNAPLTAGEHAFSWLLVAWAIIGLAACLSFGGCVYKGGKVIDGTNLAVGITVPGTEWSVNILDYVGGCRVAGQDSTHIIVTNAVTETNSYFGVVTTIRSSKMMADITPAAIKEEAADR